MAFLDLDLHVLQVATPIQTIEGALQYKIAPLRPPNLYTVLAGFQKSKQQYKLPFHLWKIASAIFLVKLGNELF